MNWWSRLWRRNRMEDDLDREIRFHLEQHTADLIRDGIDSTQARRDAALAIGGPEQVKEDCRDASGVRWLLDFISDVQYAARGLRASLGFAVVSALTLAIGIGASTTIFSAVRPILLEPLPYPDSARVVMIGYGHGGNSKGLQSFGTYEELLRRSRSFEAIAVMKPWLPTMTGPSEPERLNGQMVSAGYFRSLGVAPVRGNDFEPADDRLNGPKSVVVSDGLWRRRFSSDPGLIGRQVKLDDDLYTVVGVMPRDFENVLDPSSEIWTLLQYDASLAGAGREWGHHLRMVGRLRPGAGIDQARQELGVIAQTPLPEFARQAGSTMKEGLTVVPLRDQVTGGVRPALLAVFGAVLLVLIIACVNLTNLLLARGAGRRGEFATRAALGAGQARLIRQLITESLLIAVIGGALGILVAEFGISLLLALSPGDLPRMGAIRINGAAFAFGFGVSGLVGLLVGMAPALSLLRGNLYAGIQAQSRRMAGGHEAARRVLVVAEVALALVLLITAGLLLHSLERLFAVPPGFEPAHLLTMQVQTFGRRFDDDAVCNRFFDEALEQVRRIPGVTAAAFTTELPLNGDTGVLETYSVQREDRLNNDSFRADAVRYAVSPGYFEAMGVPLLRGRLFDTHDKPGAAARPIVISESFANQVFPNEDPIGQRLRFGGPPDRPWDVVVGVVGDVKQASLALGQSDAVYVTTDQWLWADGARWLIARSNGDETTLIPEIKSKIWSEDPDQPIVRIATVDKLLEASEAQRRFVLTLFEAFGIAALSLAVIGIYGVMSGSVNERKREIGVRAALGASGADIFGMIFLEGMKLTGAGLFIGLAGSFAARGAVAGFLFGVSRLDPATYAGVVALLCGAALIACWAPAWRAVRVDPCMVLRSE